LPLKTQVHGARVVRARCTIAVAVLFPDSSLFTVGMLHTALEPFENLLFDALISVLALVEGWIA